MLSIRWDTLVAAVVVCLLAGYLLLQTALRTTLVRLLHAFRLARRTAADEPSLYDRVVAGRDPQRALESRRRRVS